MGHKKYVNLIFIAAGALVWFLAAHYVDVLIGYFQLGRRIGAGADVIHIGLPLLLGMGTFAALRFNNTCFQFVSDAFDELVRVIFPGPREVRVGTIVVVVTCLLAGAALGVLDLFLRGFVQTVIGA
jgi:preprotein translocase SecE subunit